jgi:hypothetical protein
MTLKEKMNELLIDFKQTDNYDENETFSIFHYNIKINNWPEALDEEGTSTNEDLDCENLNLVEIGDNYITVSCGGDWQMPRTVRLNYIKDEFYAEVIDEQFHDEIKNSEFCEKLGIEMKEELEYNTFKI